MPTLAAQLSDASDHEAVTAMLRAVPGRGTDLRLTCAGTHVLGLAADPRLPAEGSICEADGWAAVVVGTLDDPPELREPSPAAALLKLIREEGPEALDRVRGVFACVVSDGRRAWAARDAIGTETLYYRETAGRLLLVSEPKQLAAVEGMRLEPDIEVVEAIFYGEEVEAGRSVYGGVRRLGMGSWLEWSGAQVTTARYWHPERRFETARLTSDEIDERFDALMGRAARRVLRGDDAVLLSGGIDSPAVAAYTGSRERPPDARPVGAISAVYPDHPGVDERPLIDMVAERYGLELHTFTPGPLRLEPLDEWVMMFDGPWAAWHPGWTEETYRFASELGYSVLLTGFFAEHVADLSRGVVSHLAATGRVRHALDYLADQRARRGTSWTSSLRQLASALYPRWLMAMYRRRRPRAIVPPWMDARRLGARDAAQAVAPRALWRHAQLGFIGNSSPAMEAYAKLQARCGVRVRHPWSDVDLWEFFISLPAEIKHPGAQPKALVRRALRGRVPDVILDRGKMVFNAFITDRIDYPSLRRWLVDPPVRISGIDYAKLNERLAAEDLPMSEFMSAKDLATAHAFLAAW